MFQNILVPIDLSAHAEPAVDAARDLARLTGARITLFHVIAEIPGAEPKEFDSFYRQLEKRAIARLEELAARFEGSELDVASTVVHGSPIQQILGFVAQRDVDLVVLASHRMDAQDGGRGWGTLSHKIGVLAPCPVLLVK